jgi:excisionase family DNA binding protein
VTASVPLPPEFIDAVAERVAAILADRQPERPAEPELLTVGEAAAYLRCEKQRVYDLTSQGRLPHVKDGARVLIRRAELLAYVGGTGERR